MPRFAEPLSRAHCPPKLGGQRHRVFCDDARGGSPWRVFGLILLLLLPVSLLAKDVPIPVAPTHWVTDTAGFLDPQIADQLDNRLRLYQEQTHHQLIVWIGKTTGDTPIEDWANRAFEKWKVGRKGIDDGLALFIMTDDHRLRFEVGYGLEPQVPDLLAKRIIDQTLTPGLRAGRPGPTINAAMEAVAMAIGQPLPGGTTQVTRGNPNDDRGQDISFGQLIFYGIIGLIVLSILATHPSLAMWLLFSSFSGGNRRNRGGWGGGGFGGGGWGGGGFGGGGFSGGGGGSGGGGASGSW